MFSSNSPSVYEVFVQRSDSSRFSQLDLGERTYSRADLADEHEVRHGKGDTENPPTSRCFLESEDGQEFIVVVQLHAPLHLENSPYRDSVVRVTIDGRQVGNQIVIGGGNYEIGSMSYTEQGRLVKANLIFSPLPTTDDRSKVTVNDTRLGDLGNIVVEIFPARVGYPRAVAGHHGRHNIPRPFDDVIYEKEKKLGVGVGLGAASDRGIAHEGPSYTRDVDYHNANVPEYRFIFQYRTRPVLQLAGIVDEPPRPAVAAVSDSKAHIAGLDGEIKGEPSQPASDENGRLKRRLASMQQEMRQLRQRISNDQPKQVVDLTEEDSEDE